MNYGAFVGGMFSHSRECENIHLFGRALQKYLQECCIFGINFESIFPSKYSLLTHRIVTFLWDENIFPYEKIKLPILSPTTTHLRLPSTTARPPPTTILHLHPLPSIAKPLLKLPPNHRRTASLHYQTIARPLPDYRPPLRVFLEMCKTFPEIQSVNQTL